MEEKLNAILESVRQIQKKQTDLENHISDIDLGLEKDRSRIQDLNIKVGSVVAEMGELRGSYNTISEKVKNKVADAIQPIVDSTDNLTTQMKRSKTVIFGVEKKNIFSRLWNEIRRETIKE